MSTVDAGVLRSHSISLGNLTEACLALCYRPGQFESHERKKKERRWSFYRDGTGTGTGSYGVVFRQEQGNYTLVRKVHYERGLVIPVAGFSLRPVSMNLESASKATFFV